MTTNYDAKAVANVLGLNFALISKKALETLVGEAKGKAADQYALFFGTDFHAARPSDLASETRDIFTVYNDLHEGISAVEEISPSPLMMERIVEHGLPRQSLANVAMTVSASHIPQASALERMVVAKTTLARRNCNLSTRESEQTERMARLFVRAEKVLGSETEASEFLLRPHPALHGEKPVGLTRTELGTKRVEQILDSIAFGLPR